MARSREFSDEQEFEKRLYYSLKKYGYLFPESEKEVDQFEGFYGDTDIDIPEHLQNLEYPKLGDNLSFDFDISYKVAAFSNSAIDEFEFPDENAPESEKGDC